MDKNVLPASGAVWSAGGIMNANVFY